MRNLFVVTHTQSLHHIEKKVGGWYDTGLTEKGRKDAAAVAAALSRKVEDEAVEIYSSDLKRASQTAHAIASRFGRKVTTTKALREISYGVAEGRPQQWLDARYTPAPDNDRLDHRGNIDEAESRRDVAHRIYPFMEAMLQRQCQTQIVVTHGFTFSLVIAAWMQIPVEACGYVYFAAPSGSITHLRQDDFFRNRAMNSLADVSHLTEN